MPDCLSIDSLVTPYVDGELTGPSRDVVEQHMRACPPCYSRVEAERAVRALLHDRQASFKRECAPALLREKCGGYGQHRRVSAWPVSRSASAFKAAGWRRRATPLAAAATLLLLVGGASLYQATESSSRVLAAELAADHMKCFAMNAVLRTQQSPAVVESSMADGFGWNMHLPEGIGEQGLELVGSRPCLYGQGKIAHIMYRHNGEPLSLFMLPKTVHADQVVQALGQHCVIWSGNDRTFVLVSREPPADVEQVAAFAHAAFR